MQLPPPNIRLRDLDPDGDLAEPTITAKEFGRVQFDATVPGNNGQSFAVHTKLVDDAGRTIIYSKTTYVWNGQVDAFLEMKFKMGRSRRPWTHSGGLMIAEDQHGELLRQVITFGPTFAQAVLGICGLGFDGRQDVARMTVADAKSVLRRAMNGQLSNRELTWWADTIEGREDIELDPSASETLTELLFVLSNPEINGRDDKILGDWFHRLSIEEGASS